jgi:hypothetical protein
MHYRRFAPCHFRLLLALCLSCWVCLGRAQKYSNDYLTIGVGARAHGMANTMTASIGDGTAGFWNPAGLTRLGNFQLNAMHAEWFAGIAKYDYLSFGNSLKNNSAFGVSVIRMGIDNIPYTFRLIGSDGSVNYDNVTPFSAADYAILGSYAKHLGMLRLGGSVKVVHRSIGRFAKAWGFGLDLGAQYETEGGFQLGLVARDVTSTFNAWKMNFTDEEKVILASNGNELPVSSVESTKPSFLLGTAYNKALSEKISLVAALDFDLTTDGQRNTLVSSKVISIAPHVGAELGFSDRVFLRAGIGNLQKVKQENDSGNQSLTMQPNFGVGLKLGRTGNFQVDYALTNIGKVSNVLYSHVFSIKIDFDASEKPSSNGNFFDDDKTEKRKSPKKKSKSDKGPSSKPRTVIEQID